MTKSDLKNGMFGKLSDGDIFVVVDNMMIYQSGMVDIIDEMNDDMVFKLSGNKVIELYEATSFNAVEEGRCKTIWKRPEKAESEAKEAKTVTITEEDFFNAITKANDKFMEISKEAPVENDELLMTMMGVQNMTFGAVIAAVLFGHDID